MERSLEWNDGAIVAVDQTALPQDYRTLRLETIDQLIGAIKRLAIRGAPAIGVAGGLGVAMSAGRHHGAPDYELAVKADAALLEAARPTAVNLSWGVQRVLGRIGDGPQAALEEALSMMDEDERVNRRAASNAAALILQLAARRPLRLLTHCNTGGLATVAWGTALGAIRDLAEQGHVESVLVGETRPLLQGARLTCWELAQAKIPHHLCVDSAAAAAIAAGMVDAILVGADRVAANGDVANKIGTYALACAAAQHGIPFVVVAPDSTIDHRTPDGSAIMVEQRSPTEVTHHVGRLLAPADTPVFNPAFDVTPGALITAIVTENGEFPIAAKRDATAAGLARQLEDHTCVIPDFPVEGVRFLDLAQVYANPALLRAAADRIASAYEGRFDCVLALEARGFPLGTAVALASNTPLVLARKPGKLPGPVHAVPYGLEYGSDSLQVQSGAIEAGTRVLIVDDVLATGGTAAAASELIRRSGAVTAGVAVLTELAYLSGRTALGTTAVLAGRTIEHDHA